LETVASYKIKKGDSSEVMQMVRFILNRRLWKHTHPRTQTQQK